MTRYLVQRCETWELYTAEDEQSAIAMADVFEPDTVEVQATPIDDDSDGGNGFDKVISAV